MSVFAETATPGLCPGPGATGVRKKGHVILLTTFCVALRQKPQADTSLAVLKSPHRAHSRWPFTLQKMAPPPSGVCCSEVSRRCKGLVGTEVPKG